METATKDRTEDLNIPSHPNSEQINIVNQVNSLATNSVEEPSVWRTIGRLFTEAIFIFAYIGVHGLIKWWLVKTGQEGEWWAQYLLTVSVFFAIIAFTVIFGCELIVNCKRAIKFAWNNLWD